MCLCVCVSAYIYIYIYIEAERRTTNIDKCKELGTPHIRLLCFYIHDTRLDTPLDQTHQPSLIKRQIH